MHTKNDEAGKENGQKSEMALREEAVLAFWREHDIFKKSVETPAGAAPVGDFVFYDGPPFATGLPHHGHMLPGTIKDAIPRFWTMNGYRVRRKWGWDCHGLPLENLIEKKLGLATKRDIEEFGVKEFNEAARDTVMEYADDWKRIIPRLGRWADMDDDYKTMDSTYTESVWWVFKTLHEKGLVYEGFKSMHLCPRCGTTLSNFEVNQGYKDIKDIAVTVKLPLLDDDGKPTDDSLLVWTTTPWTLPGNLAAAVHKDAVYVKVAVETGHGKEMVVLAKDRLEQLGDVTYEVLEEQKGSVLVGTSYQPPFPYLQKQGMEGKEHAWKIYHADYVEVEGEGTGAVHLAPAYGEEDMELAKAEGVPIFHHVDESGRFKEFVTDFAGKLVKPKDDDDAGVLHLDTDVEIVKALKENGTLFKKENITHSYPHCWRCDTPLLNYATTSWFVEVTKIKDQLVAENNKVHWVPEHVGKNRFGKWLEGARDWAVSRQRYWGAPLPVWRNPQTKEYKVFGSLAELQECVPKSGNTYSMMRHGEADHNVNGVMSSLPQNEHHLTDKGKEQVRETIAQLQEKKIDLIYVSPMQRTLETVEIVKEALGLSDEQVIIDERLIDNAGGIFENKPVDDWHAYRKQLTVAEKLTDRYEGGESWRDIKRRMMSVLFDIEKAHTNKNVLILSHGMPMQLMQWTAEHVSHEEMVRRWEEEAHFGTSEVAGVDFTPYPHNDHFELDYHRPYIDQIELYDEEVKLERVPDVFDCWFESGSMPYGQLHYPFACDKDVFLKEHFPANFISEGLDQTRGWFYSLIVLGTALFGKTPYENVVVHGLVLAEDGKKMSKKLQNYPDPLELADRVGVDTMRFYLLSSAAIRGEDLRYSEKEVQELQRKNIGRLHNVLAMYETYADGTEARDDSTDVLDVWIIARLNELIGESTAGYKNYELDRATRPIVDFIDDLSVWYLRRSRDRLKGQDETDKQATLATLRHVLQSLALVMAPAMPFYAEYLWGRVNAEGDAQSVHLARWPEESTPDPVALGEMSIVREFVTLALEQRATAGIKVRQPLPELRTQVELTPEYAELVADEVNVKAVIFDKSIASRVQLNTTITPELKAEGEARELMRQVQDMRKKAGFAPSDRIVLTLATSDAGQSLVTQFQSGIQKTVGATEIVFAASTDGTILETGEHTFTVSLAKV